MNNTKLSDKMYSILKNQLGNLKRNGASSSTLLMAREDFHSKYGIDKKDLESGYISLEDNDYKIEEVKERKKEEFQENIEEKQDQIQRFFDNELFEEEKNFKPQKIDALEYLEKQTDLKRKER